MSTFTEDVVMASKIQHLLITAKARFIISTTNLNY